MALQHAAAAAGGMSGGMSMPMGHGMHGVHGVHGMYGMPPQMPGSPTMAPHLHPGQQQVS